MNIFWEWGVDTFGYVWYGIHINGRNKTMQLAVAFTLGAAFGFAGAYLAFVAYARSARGSQVVAKALQRALARQGLNVTKFK